MGETVKIQALVLRRAEYGEADRILTLFSPEKGKITATARGVKKAVSKLRPSAELFTYGYYMLASSRGRYTVAGFDGIESFHELRENFDTVAAGMLLLEMCERTVQENEPAPEKFTLLLRCLGALRAGEDISLVLSVFMLKFCTLEGYAPETEECVHCGKTQDVRYLDIPAGGLSCAACRRDGMLSVTPGCLFFVRKVLASSMDLVFRLHPDKEQGRELYHLCCAYTAFHLGERMRLMAYLNKYHLV